MKTIFQLRKAYPELKFTKFDDLVSTNVNGLLLGLSYRNGIDTISITRPHSKEPPTENEINAVRDMCFYPHEQERVRVMPHPRIDHSVLLYRIREGSYVKYRGMD